MPTPFFHLSLANDLLSMPELFLDSRLPLAPEACSFMFGKTAPDVQSISGQARNSTHFYTLPLGKQRAPWAIMLQKHPLLQNEKLPSAAHAAFIAGYLCHLQADILWIEEIFWPYFAQPKTNWQDLKRRLFYHNVLRSYLDEQLHQGLPSTLHQCLEQVKPKHWLPFVSDDHLRHWRDFIAQQLKPGRHSQSAEVFAARMGVNSSEIHDISRSDKRMRAEIWANFPEEQLVKYRNKVIVGNLKLLQDYFIRA